MSSPADAEGPGHQPFWSDTRVKIASYLGVAALGLIGLSYRFDYDLADRLPPLPPRPVLSTDPDDAFRKMNESAEYYADDLFRDSTTYGVTPTTPDDLDRVFPYEQLTAPKALAAGESMETGSLRLSLEKKMGREGTATYPHMILRIENKTDHALAFNVMTEVGGGAEKCLEKADIPGNMLVLPPRAVIERTECIFLRGMKLQVERVETIQLAPLSFHYVSRLNPAHIGLDKRVAFAHRVPKGKTCTAIPEQAIRAGLKDGGTTWRDIVDFYARHNCDTYNFPIGYHAFTKRKQYALPVTAGRVAGDTP